MNACLPRPELHFITTDRRLVHSLTKHMQSKVAPCRNDSACRLPVAVACMLSSSLILFFSHDPPSSPLAEGLGLSQAHPHCLLHYAGQRYAFARSVDKHLTISLQHRQTNSQNTGLHTTLHSSCLTNIVSQQYALAGGVDKQLTISLRHRHRQTLRYRSSHDTAQLMLASGTVLPVLWTNT